MRKCPFCFEEISPEITRCPFCDKNLPDKKDVRWYHSGYTLFIGFLVLGPFVLPLVWTHPRYGKVTKWTITLLIIAVTVVLAKASVWALKNIMNYYKILNDTIGNG